MDNHKIFTKFRNNNYMAHDVKDNGVNISDWALLGYDSAQSRTRLPILYLETYWGSNSSEMPKITLWKCTASKPKFSLSRKP
jgi:hypothetical protein